MKDQIKRTHTFDRNSMATAFPFTTSEVGHLSGIPLGMNKQTGEPVLFDNFVVKFLIILQSILLKRTNGQQATTLKNLAMALLL